MKQETLSGPADKPRGILFSAVIDAAPRTKKTSQRIVRAGRFPKILQSEAYLAWNMIAKLQLIKDRPASPLDVPMNCRATFYRESLTGDAVGYYQALADTLENAGIITNDKLIVSWDGSRLQKDAAYPRVVVILEESA